MNLAIHGRFGMPATNRVLNCYEAGRDGFWLHRHLLSVGIENEVVDATPIELSHGDRAPAVARRRA